MCGDAARLGLYGFGAAAHIVVQVARAGPRVYAFTRPGDEAAQRSRASSARLGRPVGQAPPEPLDAAIIFAPVGALVPVALRAVARAGPSSAAGST